MKKHYQRKKLLFTLAGLCFAALGLIFLFGFSSGETAGLLERVRELEEGRRVYVGHIRPSEWHSRTVTGETRGWEKLWEGTLEVPDEAIGRSGKFLMLLSLRGHGRGQHCYFSIFLNDQPVGGDNPHYGGTLVYPEGQPLTWLSVSHPTFAVVSGGTYTLSVVTFKELGEVDTSNWECGLNGARLDYAIFPGFEVVENEPIIVSPM